jgi:anti-sigma B factor antagonist
MQNPNPSQPADGVLLAADDGAANGRPARLTVQLLSDPSGIVLALEGELDLETAAELDRRLAALDETSFTRLLIDLRRVTFMDSTGLSSIIRAHRVAEANGQRLVLRRGSSQVQRLFELTGVDARLHSRTTKSASPVARPARSVGLRPCAAGGSADGYLPRLAGIHEA